MKDLTGKTYGRLTVVSLSEVRQYLSKKNRQTKAYWLCSCNCGKEKVVRGEHLTSGRIISCGCAYVGSNRKYDLAYAQEYQAWRNMIARVNSKEPHKVKSYADIGIDERWSSFEVFLSDMGIKPTTEHSLDRINPFQPYCADNCRWATRSEQMQNTRRHYK